jgi:pyruvate dehydrogenase kinase 2/3/4
MPARELWAIPSFVRRLAQQEPLQLSIRQLRAFTADPSNLVGVARHLHRQIPVRLARRIVELDHVFPALRSHPYVRGVQGTYLSSLEAVHREPTPETPDGARAFSRRADATLKGADLTNTIEKLCVAVQDLKANLSPPEMAAAERTLQNFYTSRLTTRLELEQLLQMADGKEGLIALCAPLEVVRAAVREVEQICHLVFGAAPSFSVTGAADFRFLQVPGVLHLVVKEVLKNAARATMEAPGDPDDRPIRIDMAVGKDDVVLTIKDTGGGFSRTLLPQAFSYVFTTVERVSGSETPYLNLAGYGRGLPLARMYCEYFGGALYLLPINGVGTRCMIYISRNLDYCTFPDSLALP